jgi:hypothetical protein
MQTLSTHTIRCAILIAISTLLFASACSDETPSGGNETEDTGTSGADVTDTSGGAEVTDPSDTGDTGNTSGSEVTATCGDGALGGGETL